MVTGFFRVSVGGALPGGELWSINPAIGLFDGAIPAPNETVMAALADSISEISPGAVMRTWLSTGANINRVRVEARSLAGALEAVGEASANPIIGGTGGPNKTLQTSAVCSLETGFAGASRRGRLYWPMLSAVLDNQLRMSDADCAAVAQQMHAYLQNIAGAVNTTLSITGASMAVYSQKLALVTPVQRVSVGNVPDTQRRRRDKAVESRFSFPT